MISPRAGVMEEYSWAGTGAIQGGIIITLPRGKAMKGVIVCG